MVKNLHRKHVAIYLFLAWISWTNPVEVVWFALCFTLSVSLIAFILPRYLIFSCREYQLSTQYYKDHLFENLSLLSYFRSFEFGPTSQIWGDFCPRKWIMIFLMPTKSALYKTAVVQIVSLPYLLFLKTDQDHCKNCTVIFCINLYLFPFFKRLQIKNDLCYNLSGCNVNNHRYFYGVMY